MVYRVRYFVVLGLCLGVVTVAAGCGSIKKSLSKTKPYFLAKEEPWRQSEEFVCVRSGDVRRSAFIVPRSRIDGPSFCGAEYPLKVSALDHGRVRMSPGATLRCPMVPAIEKWIREVVQPASYRHFNQPVRDMNVISSYSCRPQNNRHGARLSEHGYANAIDIAKFTLAGGQTIDIKKSWRGRSSESFFLKEIHRGACRIFYTVLGPNYDKNHYNHFHFDLARHGRFGTKRICK